MYWGAQPRLRNLQFTYASITHLCPQTETVILRPILRPRVGCQLYRVPIIITGTQHLRCIFVGPSKSAFRNANANQKHWGGSNKQGNATQSPRIHTYASPPPPPQPKAPPKHCNKQELKWSTKQAVSADTATFVLERIVMVPGVERPFRPVRR